MAWEDDQAFERNWHGDCLLMFGEEAKQIEYAARMGLRMLDSAATAGHWPVYDIGGRSVADIGGGPCSILLKCVNRGRCFVYDPCPYPEWVRLRYEASGIRSLPLRGERISNMARFDEVWVYNCLQHTEDPQLIIANARAIAPVLRIFEWVDIPPHPGHPSELRADLLDEWIGGTGTVEELTGQNGCVGTAYYGVFE